MIYNLRGDKALSVLDWAENFFSGLYKESGITVITNDDKRSVSIEVDEVSEDQFNRLSDIIKGK